jgi:hypothetical protein
MKTMPLSTAIFRPTVERASMVVDIRITSHPSRGIQDLKDETYARAGGSARDEFDARSLFVIARVSGTDVGLVRLTPGPKCPMAVWSNGQFPVKSSETTVAMNRGLTSEKYRGMGLYPILMLESMLGAAQRGFETAVAAVEPGFPPLPFLRSLGWFVAGEPLLCEDVPRRTVVVPIVCDLRGKSTEWIKMYEERIQRARSSGLEVVRG